MRSADGGHGGAEEGFKVAGNGRVFGNRSLDGFLGDGTGIAEVDEGGEGVVASLTGCSVLRASRGRGNGYGEIVEFVFQLEDNAFCGLLADAGDAGEGGMVAGADGGDKTAGIDTAENRDGKFWADAGDGEEFFEEAFFLSLREAEESELIFTDMSVDVKGDFSAFDRKSREGGNADGDVVANAGAFDDGLVRGFGKKASAEMSDHAFVIVAGDSSKRVISPNTGNTDATVAYPRLPNHSATSHGRKTTIARI